MDQRKAELLKRLKRMNDNNRLMFGENELKVLAERMTASPDVPPAPIPLVEWSRQRVKQWRREQLSS